MEKEAKAIPEIKNPHQPEGYFLDKIINQKLVSKLIVLAGLAGLMFACQLSVEDQKKNPFIESAIATSAARMELIATQNAQLPEPLDNIPPELRDDTESLLDATTISYFVDVKNKSTQSIRNACTVTLLEQTTIETNSGPFRIDYWLTAGHCHPSDAPTNYLAIPAQRPYTTESPFIAYPIVGQLNLYDNVKYQYIDKQNGLTDYPIIIATLGDTNNLLPLIPVGINALSKWPHGRDAGTIISVCGASTEIPPICTTDKVISPDKSSQPTAANFIFTEETSAPGFSGSGAVDITGIFAVLSGGISLTKEEPENFFGIYAIIPLDTPQRINKFEEKLKESLQGALNQQNK